MSVSPSHINDFLNQAGNRDPETVARQISDWGTEQSDVLIALVRALRPSCPVIASREMHQDCCGTGGSGLPRLNTSTLVAFLCASLGFPIIKFGGRGASGRVGSVDFLEHLKLLTHSTDVSLAQKLFEQKRLTFLSAAHFYPQMAGVAKARKLLKRRTIFNMAGPLLNPTHPSLQIMGVPVFEKCLLEAINELGLAIWLVSSDSGLDEGIPGHTKIYASETAPEPPSDDELDEAGAIAMSGLSMTSSDNTQLFQSNDPLHDALNVLHAIGRPDHEVLVAWNAALLQRMKAEHSLNDLFERSLDAIKNGLLKQYAQDVFDTASCLEQTS